MIAGRVPHPAFWTQECCYAAAFIAALSHAVRASLGLRKPFFSIIGGCEFRPFCNPLYYMSQLDFLMSAAHAYHQATSDGQYDRKSSDDADSRSTLRARVHRIYLSAPVDAPAGAEV